MTVVSIDYSNLTVVERLSPKGQSEQVNIVSVPGAGNWLLKVYHEEVVFDPKLLSRIISFRSTLSPEFRRELDRRTAWPVALVQRKGCTVGVLMPIAPAEFWRTPNSGEGFEPRGGAAVASVHKQGEFFNDSCRFAIAGSLLESVLFLHQLGVVIGDLHLGNFLASANGRVLLIDMDSVSIYGESAFDFTENESFEVPFDGSGHTLRTDLYKFAYAAVKLISRDIGATNVPCCDDLIAVNHRQILEDLLAGRRQSVDDLAAMAYLWSDCLTSSGRQLVYCKNSLTPMRSKDMPSVFHHTILPFEISPPSEARFISLQRACGGGNAVESYPRLTHSGSTALSPHAPSVATSGCAWRNFVRFLLLLLVLGFLFVYFGSSLPSPLREYAAAFRAFIIDLLRWVLDG